MDFLINFDAFSFWLNKSKESHKNSWKDSNKRLKHSPNQFLLKTTFITDNGLIFSPFTSAEHNKPTGQNENSKSIFLSKEPLKMPSTLPPVWSINTKNNSTSDTIRSLNSSVFIPINLYCYCFHYGYCWTIISIFLLLWSLCAYITLQYKKERKKELRNVK